MGILDKVASFVGGGIFKEAKELVTTYFPPDMSDEQKAAFDLKWQAMEADKKAQADQAIIEAENALTNRITQLEGSAQDLRAIPIVGPIVIFLRGLQRPVWGYATLYFDYVWMTTSVTYTEKQQLALIVINLLVMTFLFGERAIQNLLPMVMEFMGKKPKP